MSNTEFDVIGAHSIRSMLVRYPELKVDPFKSNLNNEEFTKFISSMSSEDLWALNTLQFDAHLARLIGNA